jgi:anti-sigma factor (TIGR02949 family)
MNDSGIAGTIGPEHDAFAELLAGLVDGELSAEDVERVERHLAGCPACRRQLEAQTLVRTRLMRQSRVHASPGLAARVMDRITRQVALEDRPDILPVAARHQFILGWIGWILAASLAGVLLWTHGLRRSETPAGNLTPARLVSVDSHPGVMSAAVLHQFKRVDESELPRGLDLVQLKQAVPFQVNPLTAPHMRFIAAWTTELQGEPAAAIAYRCHDRLVVQYIISEAHFFRHARVRRAIAEQGVYAVSEGNVSTVAWADQDSGSFLVGEFSASELAAMRL